MRLACCTRAPFSRGSVVHLSKPAPPAWSRPWWLLGAATLAWGALGCGSLFAQEPRSFEPKDGLVCLLVNRNSGRCLSVALGSAEPGARIVQGPTPDKAGPTEHWTLIGVHRAFRLRNEHSGLVLQVWSSNLQPGVQPVQSKDEIDKAHQHWTFEPIDGAYLVRAGHSLLVLGVANSARDEGARVIQWKHVPDVQDQLWVLRPTTGNATTVVNEAAQPSDPGNSTPRGGRALVVLVSVAVLALLAVAIGVWMRVPQRRGQADAAPDEVREP